MDTATIAAPSSDATATEPNRLRWLVAAVVLLANLMDILDATIVNVAGPSIHAHLGGGASTIQWLSAGYTLAFAVLLIAGARLGDILGRRRLFLVGQVGFTLFSAACSVAPTVGTLIAFRVLQGAFGALMIPQGFGLIREAFPDEDELAKTMGMFGPVTGIAMLGAPVLAGALVQANLFGTGWRLVFLINIPIGLVVLPLAVKALPRSISHPNVKLDIPGVWLIGLALVAIIYPLIQGQPDGWPAWTFVLLAVGVALLLGFLFYEKRRTGDQLIEPTLLTNRKYLGGIAIVLSVFGAFGGLLLCISLYGQLGEGWSPIHAGLALTPMVIGMIVGMTATMPLAKKLGRSMLHVGIALIIAGTVVIALMMDGTQHASTWKLVPGLAIIGMGLGATFGQLFQFVLTSVTMEEVGSASGVLEAVQQLSSALGVAVLGTIFFSGFKHHLPSHALTITAWCCLAPLAAAFLIVFALPKEAREEEGVGH